MRRLSKPKKLFEPLQDGYMNMGLNIKYTVLLELTDRQRVFRQVIDEVPTEDNAEP